MLPLRVKHIVSKAKLLGRPLVKSLSLLDQNNTIRILRTIDNIFGKNLSKKLGVILKCTYCFNFSTKTQATQHKKRFKDSLMTLKMNLLINSMRSSTSRD